MVFCVCVVGQVGDLFGKFRYLHFCEMMAFEFLSLLFMRVYLINYKISILYHEKKNPEQLFLIQNKLQATEIG